MRINLKLQNNNIIITNNIYNILDTKINNIMLVNINLNNNFYYENFLKKTNIENYYLVGNQSNENEDIIDDLILLNNLSIDFTTMSFGDDYNECIFLYLLNIKNFSNKTNNYIIFKDERSYKKIIYLINNLNIEYNFGLLTLSE